MIRAMPDSSVGGSRPSAAAYPRPELLASTEWLADNLGRPEIRILDVRWRPDGTGREVHARGHIPGAAHLDWVTELIDDEAGEGPRLLAGPDQVGSAMARAGVGDGTTLVIYDDTDGLYAARVWWSLRVYGFESCRILDGGLTAWEAEGRPIASSQLPPVPSGFTPRAQLRMRLTTTDVRALLGSPDALLLDARPPAEYRGWEGTGRRLGHIPGAVNVPAASLTRPLDRRFRDGDELRAIARAAGVSRDRRAVCYDASGVAAAKLAFVLTLLGQDDVAVYDGGWREWGERLDLPVER
jgi:thiosulfate/3-mercaptopyruvate sulfurtransferase